MTNFLYELKYNLPYFECSDPFFNYSQTSRYQTFSEIKKHDLLSISIIDGNDAILEVNKIIRILNCKNLNKDKVFRDSECYIFFQAECDCLSIYQRKTRITSKQMKDLLEIDDIGQLQHLLDGDFSINRKLFEKILDDIESTFGLPYLEAKELKRNELIEMIYKVLGVERTDFEMEREKIFWDSLTDKVKWGWLET